MSLEDNRKYLAVQEFITQRGIPIEILKQLDSHSIINPEELKQLSAYIENDRSTGHNTAAKYAATCIVSSGRNRTTFYKILSSRKEFEWEGNKLKDYLMCDQRRQKKGIFGFWFSKKSKRCDCDSFPMPIGQDSVLWEKGSIPPVHYAPQPQECQVSSTTTNPVDDLTSAFSSTYLSTNDGNNNYQSAGEGMNEDRNDEATAVVIYNVADTVTSYMDEKDVANIDRQHVNGIIKKVGLCPRKSGVLSTKRLGKPTVGRRPLKAKFKSQYARDQFMKKVMENESALSSDHEKINIKLFEKPRHWYNRRNYSSRRGKR